MRHQFLVVIAVLTAVTVISLAPVFLAAQSPTAVTTTKTAETKTWTPPMTPWGEPDFQGIWTTNSGTPVERPPEYAAKEFFTDEERAALDQKIAQDPGGNRRPPRGSVRDVQSAYNAVFGSALRTGRRTSLIVDPSDGKMPPLTAEALKRPAQPSHYALTSTDNPEDRNFAERCLGNMLPGFGAGPSGDGTMRLVQSPGYVTMYLEYGHAGGSIRIIPTDGSPHLPSHISLWLGDSRGRWDGTTLVVDTTNFSPEVSFQTISQFNLGPRGSHENLHLVERFTRVDANTLQREILIDDPTTWTKTWTVLIELGKHNEEQNLIFESACHEGNFGLTGMLTGARAQEKAAKEAQKKK